MSIEKKDALEEQHKTISPKKETDTIDWKKKFLELEAKVEKMMEQKKPEAPALKKKALFDKERETAMVKGMFHFHEQRGKVLKWFDRFPWAGAKMTKYEAKDQTVIELPYYVARRLMEKGARPVYTELKDVNGKSVQSITDYTRRFDFFPMNDFIHVERKPKLSKVKSL